MAAGHRTLLFSQSRVMLDVIAAALAGRGVPFLRIDGAVASAAERQARRPARAARACPARAPEVQGREPRLRRASDRRACAHLREAAHVCRTMAVKGGAAAAGA